MRFSLNNIRIENGSIDFIDGPKTKHTVREMTIGIPFLSNIRSSVERFVQPYFSARIDDALYTIQGRTTIAAIMTYRSCPRFKIIEQGNNKEHGEKKA